MIVDPLFAVTETPRWASRDQGSPRSQSCSSRIHAARLLGEGLHLLIVVRGFANKRIGSCLVELFFLKWWWLWSWWPWCSLWWWRLGLRPWCARSCLFIDWAYTEAREASHASLPSFLYLSIYTSICTFLSPSPGYKITQPHFVQMFKSTVLSHQYVECTWTLCRVDFGYRALSWLVRWGLAQISKK